MSWLTPAGFAWLALLAPLVAMYVLRPRRVDKVVSSTWLWTSVARELSARHPWQKLRAYLSLLLQALALIAGALALARPSCGTVSAPGETVAIVVDASLSMEARDGAGTRLELAAKRAETITRRLGRGGRVIVIAAGPSPSQRLGASSDALRVGGVVRSTPLVGAEPHFEAALELAAARLRPVRGTKRIVVLTDGAVGTPVRAAGGIDTRIETLGRALANAGVVAADVRARDAEPDRVEIFARVTSNARASETVDVVATDDEGALLASRRIAVKQGAPVSVVATAQLTARADGRPRIVRVALTRPDGSAWRDALSADDVAVVIGPGRGRLPVLLAGDVPLALARGLRADARVEIFAVTSDAYARRAREHVAFEGLVVLGHDVKGPFPAGPSVVVSPDEPDSFGIVLASPVPESDVVTYDAADRRIRFGMPEDVPLVRVRAIGSGRALVTTRAGVAVASVRHPRGESIVLGFDLDTSALARDPAFVLFLHDTITEARETLGNAEVAEGLLGEPLRIRLPGVDSVRVVRPDGSTTTHVLEGGVAVANVPPLPGVYRVEARDRTFEVARALLDAEETDLAQRATLIARNGARVAPTRVPREQREWLPILAMVVLVLMLADAAWARRSEAT